MQGTKHGQDGASLLNLVLCGTRRERVRRHRSRPNGSTLGQGTLERRPYAKRGEAISPLLSLRSVAKAHGCRLGRNRARRGRNSACWCVVERRGRVDGDRFGLLLPAATAGVEVRFRGSTDCQPRHVRSAASDVADHRPDLGGRRHAATAGRCPAHSASDGKLRGGDALPKKGMNLTSGAGRPIRSSGSSRRRPEEESSARHRRWPWWRTRSVSERVASSGATPGFPW